MQKLFLVHLIYMDGSLMKISNLEAVAVINTQKS